jgi:glutamate-1-semialdehyde aminotransferase
MFAIHFTHTPPERMTVRSDHGQMLNGLLHLELLLAGVLICSRGDVFLSLPLTESQLSQLRSALEAFIDRHRPLINTA